MAQKEEKDWFADGDAYEGYIGRWSRPVGRMFVGWLTQPAGLRWVDIGCGTGALSETVLQRADPIRVTGVEPSDGFLGVARDRIVDDRADFRLGDAPAHFADFDDYWSPFLRGQGPAGVQCVSLSEDDRERLRKHLEASLPISPDGSIPLIARAWAVRGTR